LIDVIEAKEFEMHDFVFALIFIALVMSPCVLASKVPLEDEDAK